MSLFFNTQQSIPIILFALFNLTLSLEIRKVKKHSFIDVNKENLETDDDKIGTKSTQVGFTTKNTLPIRKAPYT